MSWLPRIHWHIGRDVTLIIFCAFAAVGAVVGASTGIASVRDVTRISGDLDRLLDGTAAQSAQAADANPDNRHLTVVSSDHESYVDLVIGASMQEGWVLGGNLPAATSGRRYMFWATTPTGEISLGSSSSIIGPRYFSLPDGATSIFVTDEAGTGAVQPSGDHLVEGAIQ